MTIEETPYVEINEVEDNSVNGDGAYIPVIIGQTGNTVSADHLKVQTFERYEDACATQQNNGIGTKLMAHLVSLAIEYHVDNITLEVRLSNEIARTLYKKFGFREVALRKFYYGDEDAVLMEKNVM